MGHAFQSADSWIDHAILRGQWEETVIFTLSATGISRTSKRNGHISGTDFTVNIRLQCPDQIQFVWRQFCCTVEWLRCRNLRQFFSRSSSRIGSCQSSLWKGQGLQYWNPKCILVCWQTGCTTRGFRIRNSYGRYSLWWRQFCSCRCEVDRVWNSSWRARELSETGFMITAAANE